MKLLKHILVVVGLLVAAVPCSHVVDHDSHTHASDASSKIYTPHACHCHSCEEVPCADDLEMPQQLVSASVSFVAPNLSVLLFVFLETKPVVRQGPPTVDGILASIQTVQLLI